MAYRAMGDAPKSIQLLCAQWCSRRHVTNRQCQHCSSGAVGDEFHMVFECPFYNGVRERFSDLFVSFGGFEIPISATTPSGAAMRAFMGQNTRMVLLFTIVGQVVHHICSIFRSWMSLNLSQFLMMSCCLFSDLVWFLFLLWLIESAGMFADLPP